MKFILSATGVLTMQNDEVLHDYSLVIKDDKIFDIRPRQEAKKTYPAWKEIYLKDILLMPSLLNMHNHLAMVLFRGLGDDMELMDWLENKIWRAEAKWVSEEFVRDGTRVAIAEMMLSGTGFSADMYFFPEVVAEVAKDMGFRMQLAAPIIDFTNAWSQNSSGALAKTEQLYAKYQQDDFISIALGPHSPYTLADESFLAIKKYMAKNQAIKLQIHLHETAEEVENSLKEFGVRPLKRLADLGILSARVQAVHTTQIDSQDLQILVDNKINIIHCAKSNLKLASGIAPIEKMRKAGLNIALGTDGAASNNSLDLFNEMQTAALVAKVAAKDAKALPAFDALAMATKNAAQILGKSDQLGILQAGAYADICGVRINNLGNLPNFSQISNLVYATNGTKVEYLWIGGKPKVKAGKLCEEQETEIKTIIKKWQGRFKEKHL